MKRLFWLLMVLFILAIFGRAFAEQITAQNEVEAFFARIFKEHQALHRLDSLADTQSKPTLQCVFPSQSPESILNCFDLLIGAERSLPTNMNQAYDLFLEIFFAAENISRGNTGAMIVNLDAYDNHYNKKVVQVMPADKWWLPFQGTEYKGLVIPFYFTDEMGSMIDHCAYFMSILTMKGKTQVWICADQALVKEMVMVMRPSISGNAQDSVDAALNAWLSETEDSIGEQSNANIQNEQNPTVGMIFAPPQDIPQETEEALSGVESTFEEPRIGIVTVTAKNTINLREEPEEKSALVATSSHGRKYICLGIADNGWYRILMRNGKKAYVAPSLVSFMKDDAE